MSTSTDNPVVHLLDVDNTLLDNDRFGADLGEHLDRTFGPAERARYWTLFSERRERLGFADYLGTLEAFRTGVEDHPQLPHMADFLLEYPFAALLYPDALALLRQLSTSGRPVLLSDGDIVFQPRKIRRSGLQDAVAGRVLVYLHKDKMMEHVQRLFPAPRYVMVDDKPNILAAVKSVLGAKVTTVFVRQGHYAHDVQSQIRIPPPDRVIERIGDLMSLNLCDLQV